MLVRFPGTPFLRQEISRATVEKRHPRDDCMRHRLWSSGVTAHRWTSPYTGDKTWHAARREEKAPGWPIRRSSPQKRKRAGRPSTSTPFLERCPQSIGLSEQKELCEARLADLIGKFTTHLLECRRQQEFPSARAHCCSASRKTSSRTPCDALHRVHQRASQRFPEKSVDTADFQLIRGNERPRQGERRHKNNDGTCLEVTVG